MIGGIWNLKLKERPAAVAGMFYPDDPQDLQRMVVQFLDEGQNTYPAPKAMIVPHAGYIYSGPVAASAYASLLNREHPIKRVVLLGPDHRVGFRGIATTTADYFVTPLGRVPIDRDMVQKLNELPGVFAFDQAHAQEHSLEVHLPFLQLTVGDFELVPLVVGSARIEDVANVIRTAWDGEETLILVSSDLSHYHSYDEAKQLDRATTAAIEQLDGHHLTGHDACGYIPVRALLEVAREKHLHEKTVDLRNSGDTAGPRDQVVGYGAYLFYAEPEQQKNAA